MKFRKVLVGKYLFELIKFIPWLLPEISLGMDTKSNFSHWGVRWSPSQEWGKFWENLTVPKIPKRETLSYSFGHCCTRRLCLTLLIVLTSWGSSFILQLASCRHWWRQSRDWKILCPWWHCWATEPTNPGAHMITVFLVIWGNVFPYCFSQSGLRFWLAANHPDIEEKQVILLIESKLVSCIFKNGKAFVILWASRVWPFILSTYPIPHSSFRECKFPMETLGGVALKWASVTPPGTPFMLRGVCWMNE